MTTEALPTARPATPTLRERWEASCPGRQDPAPTAPRSDFSPWLARQQAVRELRARPDLRARIRDDYQAFQQAQTLAGTGSQEHRQRQLNAAREHFLSACVLAQPVLTRHFPVAWQGLWNEVRVIVIDVAT